MQQTQEYQKIIEQKIQTISLPSTPKKLYDPLRYFLNLGGKRTRPSLTMLGCSLFGTPGIKALDAAIAVELFHNFTLIHDDIMDQAPLRRGKETVHEKWNENIAILSGDVLFVEAYTYLSKAEPHVLAPLLTIFNRTAREVCEGQQYDMDFETMDNVSIDQYIEMIRLKTSVLIGAALEMGAIIGGATNKKEIQAIYNFGEQIGLAFQLQDDLLDLYGDAAQFGKQIGGDILSNKKTFLLLKAFELANNQEKKELYNQLENGEGKAKVDSITSIFNQLEVRKHAEELQQIYYQNALSELNSIAVPAEQKQELLQLAQFLMSRNQ
jgi:geranylgeranyl diphosphate synthase type II